jgi:SAM-dependent methyltransferase
MGIDSNHARFLLSARKRGVGFRRTITLGRQFCVLDVAEMRSLLAEFGWRTDGDVLSACKAHPEPFLKFLGADEVVALDASPYQGASVLHDLNLPIPLAVKNAFDVVIEGGTLEHIFNFPIAVQNCMEMLVPGGYDLGIGPANTFCGHGFYQFSPDLFFRIFSFENGFKLERMILCEVQPDSDWFEVHDPITAQQFVESLGTSKPTYLLVQARKLANQFLFMTYPQQSVYHLLWEEKSPGAEYDKLIVPPSRM